LEETTTRTIGQKVSAMWDESATLWLLTGQIAGKFE